MTFIDTIITPTSLRFSAGPNVTANGSSAIGNCVNESSRTTCTCSSNDPTSTVLFDNPGLRGIPTLTGLDGDMWASQLLTIEKTSASRIAIEFHFRNNPNFTRVDRIEVVMFNCPQWVESVSVQGLETDATPISTTTISQDVTSCDSIMKVCLIYRNFLQFTLFRDSNWVHLAEMTFWVPNSLHLTPTCLSNQGHLLTMSTIKWMKRGRKQFTLSNKLNLSKRRIICTMKWTSRRFCRTLVWSSFLSQ